MPDIETQGTMLKVAVANFNRRISKSEQRTAQGRVDMVNELAAIIGRAQECIKVLHQMEEKPCVAQS